MSAPQGLWSELKRRNVFRVAAAYVVVGWLVLQVAEILLSFTGAPDWVGKALIALLLLGFVPTLALAWVFEVGPHGVRRDDGTSSRDASPQARRLDVITLGAVVFVVILLAWQHLGPAFTGAPVPGDRSSAGSVRAPEPVSAPESPPQQPRPRLEPPPFEVLPGSIAVLPFTNRSAEPDTAYFVDGIHDDLLTQLARNSQLKVISRTSMMEYRDTTKNLRQIGEELAVAAILEGAVQRAGARVRINAQLIDTASDAHLWADTFDRELTPENIFDIQSEIAVAIAGALGRTLGANAGVLVTAEDAVPTRNAAAFDLYLRARSSSDDWSEGRIRERIALYQQALAEDPGFALAMAELGSEHTKLFWFVTRRDGDREEGRRWIDRALALEPDNARFRLLYAEYLYRAHLDFDGALRELERAALGLPGSAETIALRSFILRRTGRSREAVESLQSAVLLGPRSHGILITMVENAWLLGDLESARSWHERLMALPDILESSRLQYAGARALVLGDLALLRAALADGASDMEDSFVYGAFNVQFLARDFAAAAAALDAQSEAVIEDQFFLMPVSLRRAWLAFGQGDEAEAKQHAAIAVGVLDGILAEHPEDYRALMARAQALAILGDGAAARDSAARSLAMQIPSRDMLIRAELRARELIGLAVFSDTEALARALADYLQLEMKYWHFDGLMLHPAFDRHREHPAMQALAARYSRRGSGS